MLTWLTRLPPRSRVLGFAAWSESEIEQAVRTMARCLKDYP